MQAPSRILVCMLSALLCQCKTAYTPSPSQQPMTPIFGAPTPKTARTAKPKPSPVQAQPDRSYPPYPTSATAPAPAPWHVEKTSSSETLHPAAHYYQVRLSSPQTDIKLNVVIFDSRQLRLSVLDQPNPDASGRIIADTMRHHRAVAGVNGGFFTADFRPIGLTIANGKPLAGFTTTSLITGTALQLGAHPYLIWNAEYQGHSGVTDAIQAGPRLVDSSRPLPGLDTSKSRARTFIASNGDSLWAIGTTSPCSLGALAQALVTPGALPGLKPMRALNLDGGNSTALWLRNQSGKETSHPGWSTVRNYLAVVPK
jgi:hypothetical protein